MIMCDISDMEFDWWNVLYDKLRSGYIELYEEEEEDDEDDDVGFVISICLNLENEDLLDDLLCEYRFVKYLQLIEKLKYNKGDFVERVIFVSGCRVGRWLDFLCMNEVNVLNVDKG